MTTNLDTIYANVLQGQNDQIEVSVQKALEDNLPAGQILTEGLIAAMEEVGKRFETGDYFVPEMLIAARAMKTGLVLLRPLLVEEGVEAIGKAVIGTVQGDLHDIGKNLLGMMFEGAGFEVVDLGTDVAPEKFAEAARAQQPDIVGLSALLTTTMQKMPEVIEAIEDMGVRNKVRVLVGGAPLTSSFAEEIGADGYAPDASVAVSLATSLLRNDG